MSRFFRSSPDEPPQKAEESGPDASTGREPDESGIEGDRGIASVNQRLSLQFRLSNVLAMGLMLALGLGFLSWYYAHAFALQASARRAAQNGVHERAQGDVPLPALGRVDPPSVAEELMGPPPALPSAEPTDIHTTAANAGASHWGADPRTSLTRTADHRLSGPVFSGSSDTAHSAAAPVGPLSEELGGAEPDSLVSTASIGEAVGRAREVGGWLQPSATPAVRARVLPTQQMLLPKGAFIDCTLETAIDSSLPGLTTCVTASDTFGADGTVVLLERGTKLVGETRGEVQQGMARLFVLWTEARTPTGVVVPLASPGTDELGRSGLPGVVNRHFLQRFGAAILVSVIDGAVQARSGARGVIVNPSASQDVMTAVLKTTLAIPPTVVKRNGDRIEILVARDLDFRTVYELRSVATRE